MVKAPILTKKTKIGQIFRLQNYHSFSDKENIMEGVALTTYKIDAKKGEITVMVAAAGASSKMIKNLKIGQPIIFMGPSGIPTHIAKNKKITLIAGGRGIFPLASLAKAHVENGCQVDLFCGFRSESDLVRYDELKNSCDNLILAFENESIDINKKCPKQIINNSNVVEAVKNYYQHKDDKIDVVLTMGNEDMMHEIAKIYHQDLAKNLSNSAIGIVSLNNPMQCMLKGVCSQCLQRKIDKNGQEKFFFSCLAQDQKIDEIDFEFLKSRCGQNSLEEKITDLFLQHSN